MVNLFQDKTKTKNEKNTFRIINSDFSQLW